MPSPLPSPTNPGPPPPCLRLRCFYPVELAASALGPEASPGGASGRCCSRSYSAGYARHRHRLEEARAMVDEGGARQGRSASLRILAGRRQWPLINLETGQNRTQHGFDFLDQSAKKRKFTVRIRDNWREESKRKLMRRHGKGFLPSHRRLDFMPEDVEALNEKLRERKREKGRRCFRRNQLQKSGHHLI